MNAPIINTSNDVTTESESPSDIADVSMDTSNDPPPNAVLQSEDDSVLSHTSDEVHNNVLTMVEEAYHATENFPMATSDHVESPLQVNSSSVEASNPDSLDPEEQPPLNEDRKCLLEIIESIITNHEKQK